MRQYNERHIDRHFGYWFTWRHSRRDDGVGHMNAFDYLQEQIDVNGVMRYRRHGSANGEVGAWRSVGPIMITRHDFYRDYREAVRRRDELDLAIESMRKFIGDLR